MTGHHSHKLHELSSFERDNLIASIAFVDHPRQFLFPTTLPFLGSQHIVNYSEFYDSLEQKELAIKKWQEAEEKTFKNPLIFVKK